MLSFDRTPLADAIAAINRYNSTRIVIAAPGIAGLRVTGAFHASDPAGFARAAAAMFGLATARAPDGSIILAPAKKT
jgi:transmembrane sensor